MLCDELVTENELFALTLIPAFLKTEVAARHQHLTSSHHAARILPRAKLHLISAQDGAGVPKKSPDSFRSLSL